MSTIESIRFSAQVRYWDRERASGLAVADIPAEQVSAFGGLRQQRVQGSIAGAPFTSNVMPAGGGRLALSVSKAMMKDASVAVGDWVEVEVVAIGSD